MWDVAIWFLVFRFGFGSAVFARCFGWFGFWFGVWFFGLVLWDMASDRLGLDLGCGPESVTGHLLAVLVSVVVLVLGLVLFEMIRVYDEWNDFKTTLICFTLDFVISPICLSIDISQISGLRGISLRTAN